MHALVGLWSICDWRLLIVDSLMICDLRLAIEWLPIANRQSSINNDSTITNQKSPMPKHRSLE
jgi:hypothetical protein